MQLIIAEKPSVGIIISKALGGRFKREDGYIESDKYIISWCLGHLVSLADAEAYDERYSVWNVADLPIIPEKWKYIVQSDKKEQYGIIKKLMNDEKVDEIVCATDAGREGELIFRLVYAQAKCKKPWKRLWTSSLEENVICEGFKNLKCSAEYDNLYNSALCRSKADWIVGINATRTYTKLYNRRLNVGRVQTPTLAMIYERDMAIKNFVKTKHYNLHLKKEDLIAVLKNIESEEECLKIKSICEKENQAVVVKVVKEEKRTSPPKLYDLTSLQREANKKFGYTAQQTLNCVQSLYEKKLSTYPRTDSRFITEDMQGSVLNICQKLAERILNADENSFKPNISLIINNKKVSDHHAIIPTINAVNVNETSLSEEEVKILNLIKIRLLSAVHNKYVYESITADINCADNNFVAYSKNIIDYGWKNIENIIKSESEEEPEEDEKVESNVDLFEGQVIYNPEFEVKELYNSPPKHYTEDTLLSAMERAGASETVDEAERKGLGTPATRAGIIERLIKCEFVKREKKNLLITENRATLVNIVPERIKSSRLTAEWENQLAKMVKGQAVPEKFMEDIVLFTNSIVDEAKNTLDTSKVIKRSEGIRRYEEKDIIGKCPRCGKNVVDTPKAYSCEDRKCGFILWKDNRYFQSLKKNFTKTTVKGLLKGRTKVKGLTSKSGKKYDAYISLEDNGERINFKMEFN